MNKQQEIWDAFQEIEKDNNGDNFNNWMAALGKGTFGVCYELEDGSIMGHANTDAWDNAKWYQKLLGYFWRKYKNRFIKPEPFKAEFTDDQCAGCGRTMTLGYCDNGCDDY
ncbi:hypothetical protein KAR91_25595 [Candidatus Pacearchaeota archaeon]|nr:hypothetical protein [Candidatus Pacearchaeota archaeon]